MKHENFWEQPMSQTEYEAWSADYEARCEQAHAEMNAYFATLPAWVSDEDKFSLWMMTDKEREAWFAANMTRSAYLKPSSDKKPVRVGNIRI